MSTNNAKETERKFLLGAVRLEGYVGALRVKHRLLLDMQAHLRNEGWNEYDLADLAAAERSLADTITKLESQARQFREGPDPRCPHCQMRLVPHGFHRADTEHCLFAPGGAAWAGTGQPGRDPAVPAERD